MSLLMYELYPHCVQLYFSSQPYSRNNEKMELLILKTAHLSQKKLEVTP